MLIAGAVVRLDDSEVSLLQFFSRSFVYERFAGLNVIVETFPSGVAQRPCGVGNEGAMVVSGCVRRSLFSKTGPALWRWRINGSIRFETDGVKSGVVDRFIVRTQNFRGVRVDRGFLRWI